MTHGTTIPYITEVNKVGDCKFIGNIYGHGTSFAGAVWDKNHISPTLNTMQGGGREPMIVDADLMIYDDYNNRVVDGDVIGTITPEAGNSALRHNYKLIENVQVKQATKQGKTELKIGGVADLSYPKSETRRGRVIDEGNTSPTLTTENIPSVIEPWTWRIDDEYYRIRIRKLTPRECWRLMGFTDADFDKAAEVNSNTQLYKQAGNSIVVNVLEAIFTNLIDDQTPVSGSQITFDDLLENYL